MVKETQPVQIDIDEIGLSDEIKQRVGTDLESLQEALSAAQPDLPLTISILESPPDTGRVLPNLFFGIAADQADEEGQPRPIKFLQSLKLPLLCKTGTYDSMQISFGGSVEIEGLDVNSYSLVVPEGVTSTFGYLHSVGGLKAKRNSTLEIRAGGKIGRDYTGDSIETSGGLVKLKDVSLYGGVTIHSGEISMEGGEIGADNRLYSLNVGGIMPKAKLKKVVLTELRTDEKPEDLVRVLERTAARIELPGCQPPKEKGQLQLGDVIKVDLGTLDEADAQKLAASLAYLQRKLTSAGYQGDGTITLEQVREKEEPVYAFFVTADEPLALSSLALRDIGVVFLTPIKFTDGPISFSACRNTQVEFLGGVESDGKIRVEGGKVMIVGGSIGKDRSNYSLTNIGGIIEVKDASCAGRVECHRKGKISFVNTKTRGNIQVDDGLIRLTGEQTEIGADNGDSVILAKSGCQCEVIIGPNGKSPTFKGKIIPRGGGKVIFIDAEGTMTEVRQF
jgi:hypothetical protein